MASPLRGGRRAVRCLRASRAPTPQRPAAHPLCGLRRRSHPPGPGRSVRTTGGPASTHSLPAGTRLGTPGARPGGRRGPEVTFRARCRAAACAPGRAPSDPAPQERSAWGAPPGRVHRPAGPQVLTSPGSRSERGPPSRPDPPSLRALPAGRALSPGCCGDGGFGPAPARSLGAQPASPRAPRAGEGPQEPLRHVGPRRVRPALGCAPAKWKARG